MQLIMAEKLLILALILLLGYFSKNQTIVIAVLILIGAVIMNLDDASLLKVRKFSIKYGIILITIYAFIPIAKGDIRLIELIKAFQNWRAWIAITAGILVTHFAKYGIEIMDTSPDVTTFVLVGIILGILVFGGVASGPLIGSGIALMLYGIIEFLIKIVGIS